MNLTRRTIFHAGVGLAGAAVLSMAALATPASAAGTTTQNTIAAACSLSAGSVTAAGAQNTSKVTAGTPPTATKPNSVAGVYKPEQVRVATRYTIEPTTSSFDISGFVLQGDSLYRHHFWRTGGGQIDPSVPNSFTRVGGGWTNFAALETSSYEGQDRLRRSAYGLNTNGSLYRWDNSAPSWRATGSAPGFASVKSLVLISKTYSSDTFLANTRSGALYTIQIPAGTPMKPIVTKVRDSGWQSFEKLIAERCGQHGTLLLGIDKDSKAGFLYAVGTAAGTSTVINNLGKVNGTFPDAVNFRFGVVPDLDPL